MHLLSSYGLDKIRIAKSESGFLKDIPNQLNELIICSADNKEIIHLSTVDELLELEELNYLGIKNSNLSFHVNFGEQMIPYNLNPIYDLKGEFAHWVMKMLSRTESELITYGASTSVETLQKMHFTSLYSYISQDISFFNRVDRHLSYKYMDYPNKVFTNNYEKDKAIILCKLLEMSNREGFHYLDVFSHNGEFVIRIKLEDMYDSLLNGKPVFWLGDMLYAEIAISKHRHSAEDFIMPVRSVSSILDIPTDSSTPVKLLNSKTIIKRELVISANPLK